MNTPRSSSRGRAVVAVVAAAGTIAATSLVVPTSASASTPTGSSYSAAAHVGVADGLQVKSHVTGLLSFVSPVLDQVLNPLLDALTALAPELTSAAVQAVSDAGLSASNEGTATPDPADGYPDNCPAPWTSDNCYGGTITPTLGPLLSLSIGSAKGYAADADGKFSADAQIVHPIISFFGIPILDAGTIESSSLCTLAGDCTHTQDVHDLSLLGDQLQGSLADGRFLVTIDGAHLRGASVPLSVAGVGATVSVNGNLLTMKLALDLTHLLDALGLGSLLDGVVGLVNPKGNGPSAVLTITLGPGNTPGGGDSGAWGLEVGVDLSVNVTLNLLGVVGAHVSVPSGITGENYGNLLDLKLGYTNAEGSTATPGSSWYPPGLI